MTERERVPDTRAVVAQAIDYLITCHSCSCDEAREHIRQEAMAKRATLDEVARALVVGEAVRYRPNVPGAWTG